MLGGEPVGGEPVGCEALGCEALGGETLGCEALGRRFTGPGARACSAVLDALGARGGASTGALSSSK